jgi:hypothetical protein
MATGSRTQDFYPANGRYGFKPEVTSVAAMSGLPPKLDIGSERRHATSGERSAAGRRLPWSALAVRRARFVNTDGPEATLLRTVRRIYACHAGVRIAWPRSTSARSKRSQLVKAAVEGRLPRGINIERLRDTDVEWGQQFRDLGLDPN